MTAQDYQLLNDDNPAAAPEREEMGEIPPTCCRSTTDSAADERGGQGCSVPKRYVIVVLLFVAMIIVNAQRVNVGVTVVTILDHDHVPPMTIPQNHAAAAWDLTQLSWTPKMVGWLHSVFYIGLLISQVPCGYIVTKFPSHRLFGGCCLVTCALNFLVPVSIIKIGFGMTCTVRLLQGLIEGLLYPSCYDVLRHWTLPEERSRMGASVLTGSYIGPTLGMIVSGLLTYYIDWTSVFYVHGAAGILWYIIWLLLAYEKPSSHPTISVHEQKTMESKQGSDTTAVYEHDRVPWFAIMTSLPVYALIVCNFARSFVFYMLLTNQPTYLNTFHFLIAENGLFSSLPHAFMALFCVISGTVADYLMSGQWFTATVIRKLFTCIGFGVEAVFFFGLALTSDRTTAVTFLTIGVGISGIAISGWQINHLDLAPRYAGILVAITMTFGTLAGVFNPIIVAVMTEDQKLTSWHNVFWMTGGVLTCATIFYAVFGSGERQEWAVPKPPTQRVVTKLDPLEAGHKPYGTFHAQLNDKLEETSQPAELDTIRQEKAETFASYTDLDEPVKRMTTNFNFSPSASVGDRESKDQQNTRGGFATVGANMNQRHADLTNAPAEENIENNFNVENFADSASNKKRPSKRPDLNNDTTS